MVIFVAGLAKVIWTINQSNSKPNLNFKGNYEGFKMSVYTL